MSEVTVVVPVELVCTRTISWPVFWNSTPVLEPIETNASVMSVGLPPPATRFVGVRVSRVIAGYSFACRGRPLAGSEGGAVLGCGRGCGPPLRRCHRCLASTGRIGAFAQLTGLASLVVLDEQALAAQARYLVGVDHGQPVGEHGHPDTALMRQQLGGVGHGGVSIR